MTSISSLLDPLMRPRRTAAASSCLCVLLLLLAGCVSEPTPPQAGGPIPLQLHNGTNATREVRVEVRETAAGSVLLSSDERVEPRRTRVVSLGMVGHGDYVLVAKAGLVTREAKIEFHPGSEYFRFIVEDNIIAFQSG